MSRIRNVCFTCNNYTEDRYCELLNLDIWKYIVIGKEVGDSGTPHLQGYGTLKKQTTYSKIQTLLKGCHVEGRKGTHKQAAQYCKKDGLFEEAGEAPAPGTRNDLEVFKATVKSGITDLKRLREDYSDIFAKYPRFCLDYVGDNLQREKPEAHPLREWQADLFKELKLPPDDRSIHFFVDKEGNSGKTWFAKYYLYLFPQSFYLRPTKHADMAFAIPEDTRVLFLDCTRQQVEHLPYTFLEACKDGLVFSSKYESRMKVFKNMHIVVFMNQDPDMEKLSADRYIVTEL